MSYILMLTRISENRSETKSADMMRKTYKLIQSLLAKFDRLRKVRAAAVKILYNKVIQLNNYSV
jgi:hypothetical protein